jgi:hypothetical protein
MPNEPAQWSPGPIEFIDRHFDWFLSIFIITMGGGILFAGTLIPKENVWYEIVRDAGIAFLIAAIVSTTYETFARSRFLRRTMETMLSDIFGNIVHPDIWKVVKDEIIRHQIIRECLDIQLKLLPKFGPGPGPMVLWLRIDYDLKGLHDSPKTKPLPLRHFLDDHIVKDEYPCFNSITINRTPQPLDIVRAGVFETMVELPPKHADPIKVSSVREEVTYVPGSYYLTMTELTKGIKLQLTEIPEGIEAFVSIRPYMEKVAFIKDMPLDDEFENTILLPGHSIEFRFKMKDKPSAELARDTPAAL